MATALWAPAQNMLAVMRQCPWLWRDGLPRRICWLSRSSACGFGAMGSRAEYFGCREAVPVATARWAPARNIVVFHDHKSHNHAHNHTITQPRNRTTTRPHDHRTTQPHNDITAPSCNHTTTQPHNHTTTQPDNNPPTRKHNHNYIHTLKQNRTRPHPPTHDHACNHTHTQPHATHDHTTTRPHNHTTTQPPAHVPNTHTYTHTTRTHNHPTTCPPYTHPHNHSPHTRRSLLVVVYAYPQVSTAAFKFRRFTASEPVNR